jgi:aryl-alcohol dehydrogenase-like predicted oxidoreductase
MLWPQPEADVFPLCAANGIGQIVFSPLSQGVLTGKYQPGHPPPKDSRAASPAMNGFFNATLRSDRVLSAVQALRPMAQGLGLTMSQLALAWVLRLPEVASAIIGASRPEQVSANAAASGVKLTDEVLTEIHRVIAPAAEEVRRAA